MSQSSKRTPWKGWKKQQPSSTKQRRKMLEHCGRRCFLGKKISYPICTKNTCTINKKGVYSAYIRARATKKNGIATRAKQLIKSL